MIIHKFELHTFIMDSFILGEDIRVVCYPADRFPEGIQNAHETLHGILPYNPHRRLFGMSRPDENGVVIYKAAAEILDSERFPALENTVIKGGSYNTYYIQDYRENTDAIAECFELLTGQAETDPNGYCIEWYIGENDVKCMVRCDDENYPVDNDNSHKH